MTRPFQLFTLLLLVSLTFFLGSGCETEPSSQIALGISPNTVTLRVGESQEFVASGFQDYTWEIVTTGDDPPGVLSTKKGDRTVFTAGPGGEGASSPGSSANPYWEPLVVTLRVSGIPLESTDPTGENSYLASAEALITIHPLYPDTSYPPASPDPDPAWEPDPADR
jgi:hypothetical protein